MQTEPFKAGPPKRKRRSFQFSLRTLMIVVTLICAVAALKGVIWNPGDESLSVQ
jgi:hypothetical protein